jgi:GGDEF domain-containing protein
MEETHVGFGLLRIRLLGLVEFREKHGPQSVLPFLRTAAQTLRHSLDAENFLGGWGEHEFLAVLQSASPAMVSSIAETLWNLLRHTDVTWWGDRFPVEAEVSRTVATTGCTVESLLDQMQPSHTSGTANAAAAGAGKDLGRLRG